MKQVCLLCDRSSLDGNLYCQEPYCPAEMSPTILDKGEWCSDVEITRPVIVLRSAVLYEAEHQKRKVLLKIAHPGSENKERLKREAEFLRDLQLKRAHQRTLPYLLPPYTGTSLSEDAYGKIMLGGHLLYYYLFEHFEGEPLRDILAQRPQLWVNHVGWLASDLAATVNYLHSRGLFHYGLSPECMLVRFDEKPNAPRLLLIDLGIAARAQELAQTWYPSFVLPAYTAPELLNAGTRPVAANYRTDVYGTGVVLYEMLVGRPAFPFRLQSDAEVFQAVSSRCRTPMNRVEDVVRVATIATTAVSQEPAERPENASEVVRQLEALFGPVPPEKKKRRLNLNTLIAVVGVLLAVAFLIALALSLAGPIR